MATSMISWTLPKSATRKTRRPFLTTGGVAGKRRQKGIRSEELDAVGIPAVFQVVATQIFLEFSTLFGEDKHFD